MDVYSAYNQFPIYGPNEEHAVFVIDQGLCCYKFWTEKCKGYILRLANNVRQADSKNDGSVHWWHAFEKLLGWRPFETSVRCF